MASNKGFYEITAMVGRSVGPSVRIRKLETRGAVDTFFDLSENDLLPLDGYRVKTPAANSTTKLCSAIFGTRPSLTPAML